MNTPQEPMKLIQSPVITHHLEVVASKVDSRISALNLEKQVATSDTIGTLKALRAELNKEAKEFEEQRKLIKKAVLDPYEAFNAVYEDKIKSKYATADTLLKEKINTFELSIKSEKLQTLKQYFSELVESEQLGWLTYERFNPTINLTTSDKKYRDMANDFIEKIKSDVALIATEQYPAETMAEYKSSLNASFAIRTVRERKQAEKIEAERIQLQRTQVRQSELRKIGLISSDLAKCYHHLDNTNISISWQQVQTEDESTWQVTLAGLTLRVQAFKNQTAKVSAPTVSATAPQQQPSQELKQQPLQEYTARFEVVTTIDNLKKIKSFLNENKINFKSI